MPLALEQLDLRKYDLVISSEFRTRQRKYSRYRGTLHVCYCHTIMRYLLDMYHELPRRSRVRPAFDDAAANPLLETNGDFASAARVDSFVANSQNVAARIRKTYRRDATVIHPPVDVQRFRADRPREELLRYSFSSRWL